MDWGKKSARDQYNDQKNNAKNQIKIAQNKTSHYGYAKWNHGINQEFA